MMPTTSEAKLDNIVKVKVIHQAVSDMPNLQRELPSQVFKTFVSIRNDRHIMEHKSDPCDPQLVDFLIDQVKVLESEVIAGLRKEREEREREKMEYKRITALVEHDIEMWAEQKREEILEKDAEIARKDAEIAQKSAKISLLRAKLAKQRRIISRQKRLSTQNGHDCNSSKKSSTLETYRQHINRYPTSFVKSRKEKLRKPKNDDERSKSMPLKHQNISTPDQNLTLSRKSESESAQHPNENDSAYSSQLTLTAEPVVEDIRDESSTVVVADVVCQEISERIEEMQQDEKELDDEVEVLVEPRREIEILSEKSLGDVSTTRISKADEHQLKTQVVSFVGRWLKKNVPSFDYSEAAIKIVQSKTTNYCAEIKKQYFSSDRSLDTKNVFIVIIFCYW